MVHDELVNEEPGNFFSCTTFYFFVEGRTAFQQHMVENTVSLGMTVSLPIHVVCNTHNVGKLH